MSDQNHTSQFDAEAFMQQTVDGPLETEYKLVPAGEYQNVFIDDFDSKVLQLIEGDGTQSKSGKPYSFLKCSLPFKLTNDPRLLAEFGNDTARVYKEFNIDRDADGKIATGTNKNVELGRLYDAAGLNAGQKQLPMLRGTGPFVITVVHESGKRKDGSDWKQAKVSKVTRQA